TDRPGVSGLTGEVARTLAARSFRGRLDATVMLSEHGRLRSLGMLTAGPPGDLSGVLRPDPTLLAWLTGLPPTRQMATAEFPARRLATVPTIDDVVLPAAARARVSELENRIAHRGTVVEEWGFGAHHDNVAGVVALFHGPPGTGKTMTAAAIAAATRLPAYQI